ncbi:hypothetical protein [Streptomyces venezuelae]|uniref:hypothetical protein n=1 Tax=Streptomyces venezuelae TaxID=54571 RepID=UPI0033319BD8
MPESKTDNWATALRYIAGRKAAEESLGFLAHVSALIRTTPEPDAVLTAVARACVPFFGSAVLLEAPALGGIPVTAGAEGPAAALPELLAAAGPGQERVVFSDHEGLAGLDGTLAPDRLRERGADSGVGLRLSYRGVPGGRLALVRAGDHRRGPIGPGDLGLLGEVADRLAAFNAFAGLSSAGGAR